MPKKGKRAIEMRTVAYMYTTHDLRLQISAHWVKPLYMHVYSANPPEN